MEGFLDSDDDDTEVLCGVTCTLFTSHRPQVDAGEMAAAMAAFGAPTNSVPQTFKCTSPL